MGRKYEIVPVEIPDIPMIPGSIAARKAILRHEITEDEVISRHSGWKRELYSVAESDKTDYHVFLEHMAASFLVGSQDQNSVFSPLSAFHALAAMAALTLGDTQQEILSVMGLPDLDAVRKAMSVQYRVNLMQGRTGIQPAAMLWFDQSVDLNLEKMQKIAHSVYAGVRRGSMTDQAYRTAISAWLNQSAGTGIPMDGRELDVDEKTRLILLTTFFFQDTWDEVFDPRRTKTALFHARNGDVRVPYMQQSQWLDVWFDDDFTAIPLSFVGDHVLWIVLSRIDLTPEEILRRGFLSRFPPDWGSREHRDVHLAIPRFDLSTETDLLGIMHSLGTDRLFGDGSETPYTTVHGYGIKVDQARHRASIKINERGCEASACTILRGVACAGVPQTPPRLDFIVDRPFLFVLTGRGKLPLFMGIVHTPEVI